MMSFGGWCSRFSMSTTIPGVTDSFLGRHSQQRGEPGAPHRRTLLSAEVGRTRLSLCWVWCNFKTRDESAPVWGPGEELPVSRGWTFGGAVAQGA